MTKEGLQKALIDMGWMTLIHRVLNGKPCESYALFQLMRAAGRPVTVSALAAEYEAHATAGGAYGPHRTNLVSTGSVNGVRKRIERLRACLSDLGIGDVITTLPAAYMIEARALTRVETALLAGCGIELEGA